MFLFEVWENSFREEFGSKDSLKHAGKLSQVCQVPRRDVTVKRGWSWTKSRWKEESLISSQNVEVFGIVRLSSQHLTRPGSNPQPKNHHMGSRCILSSLTCMYSAIFSCCFTEQWFSILRMSGNLETSNACFPMTSIASLNLIFDVRVWPWKITGSPSAPSQQSSSTQRHPCSKALQINLDY